MSVMTVVLVAKKVISMNCNYERDPNLEGITQACSPSAGCAFLA